MGCQATGDVAEFLDMAGDYLRRDRTANTVMLTVTAPLRINPAGAGTRPGAADGAVDPAAAPLFGWRIGPGWRMDPVGGAFMHKVGAPGGDADHRAEVRQRLDYGGLTLWTADSRPAALAGRSRPVAGMVRIGPVCTPPEQRGHGYASVVTAEVSGQALDAGAEEVLLYTDLANPVSNSVYQRIGYRAVAMRVSLSFSPSSYPPGYLALSGRGGILGGIMSLPGIFPLPLPCVIPAGPHPPRPPGLDCAPRRARRPGQAAAREDHRIE